MKHTELSKSKSSIIPTFRETIYSYVSQEIAIDTPIYNGSSEFQDIVLFYNKYYGHVLVLDGVVQLTERDEFVYSEMLAHVPLHAHPSPKRVLIIGGGDGCVLEETLKHAEIEEVILVDIDGVVLDLCREHFRAKNSGAFDDPRVTIIVADGMNFVRESDQRFDIIILDGPDPIGPGEAGKVLFSNDFFEACARNLNPGGLLVIENDVPFHHPEAVTLSYNKLSPTFSSVKMFVASIPSFLGGYTVFVSASVDGKTQVDQPRPLQVEGLEYYSTAVHSASFALPNYIERLIH